MDLRLGLVGRGYWGNVYAKVLTELGITFWQAGRDWREQDKPDGLIIASSTGTHYAIAREALLKGIPVLVEKPVCLTSAEARELIKLGGIVYAGHTRLYDPGWEQFKASLPRGPRKVEAWAGGVNETNPDAWLNWISHLVPLCRDLGVDPHEAVFHISEEKKPLRLTCCGREFRDGPPGALKNLIQQFCRAIKQDRIDNWGAYQALFVAQFLESHEPR